MPTRWFSAAPARSSGGCSASRPCTRRCSPSERAAALAAVLAARWCDGRAAADLAEAMRLFDQARAELPPDDRLRVPMLMAAYRTFLTGALVAGDRAMLDVAVDCAREVQDLLAA